MKNQAPAKTPKTKHPTNVSVVEAREKFSDLVNRTAMLSERVYVTKHGKPVAALVSVEDANLLEALEDKYDLAAVKKARTDIAKHGTVSLEALVKELGL